MPIFSVHEDTRAGLRAVCMPYFGGASLSSVLERLWSETGRPTRGGQLVEALEPSRPRAERWAIGRQAASGPNRRPRDAGRVPDAAQSAAQPQL